MARLLTWVPWLSLVLVSIPLPVVFLLFFLTSTATDSAAVYLLLSFVSLGAWISCRSGPGNSAFTISSALAYEAARSVGS